MSAITRLVCLAKNVTVASKVNLVSSILSRYSPTTSVAVIPTSLTSSLLINPLGVRNGGFLGKISGEQLWKSATNVSSAGKKRGRAKRRGRNMTRNLGRGQVIGYGKVNMVWPGLNSPIMRGKEIIERRELPPDTERERRLFKLRDENIGFRRIKLTPLERGFSGNKWPGRSFGPPDPIIDEKFEGFDSKILELKRLLSMHGTHGRQFRLNTLVVTGNKNGSAGFSSSKAKDPMVAMRKAKNRGAQRLIYIDRCNDHTVYHDFCAMFGETRIFVHKKPRGYGLVCHRVLRCICEMIGITDLHAKVEGSSNANNVTKAFFLGLIKQKTFQDMANEKGLYLVEYSKEYDDFPRVVAAPKRLRTDAEIPKNESLDFEEYIHGGKMEYKKPKRLPFYARLPGWQRYLKRTHPYRNLEEYKVKTMAEYDALTSFILKDGPNLDPVASAAAVAIWGSKTKTE